MSIIESIHLTPVELALSWANPQRERIWTEPSDADESAVLISTAYVPGACF